MSASGKLLAIAIVLFGLFVWAIKGMLTAFVVGVILAYVLNPAVGKLQRLGLGRGMASLVPVAVFYALGVLALTLAIPPILREGLQLASALPTNAVSLGLWLNDWLHTQATLYNIDVSGLDMAALTAQAATLGQKSLGFVLTSLDNFMAGMGAIGSVLALVLITPVVTFYLLQEWHGITAFTASMVPPHLRHDTLALWQRIDSRLAGFMRGQLLVAVVQGTFYGLALTLAGVNMGFVLGMLVGVLSFIPMVGGLVGMALTFACVALQFQLAGWEIYGIVAAIFTVGGTFENFYLTPKLVGDNVGLHPVWVMFALMAGAELAGFTGVLVAVPVAAIMAEIVPLLLALWRAQSGHWAVKQNPKPKK
ncbi:MAG: AI-2E family transporter [Alphaproteobacteria bacterium]